MLIETLRLRVQVTLCNLSNILAELDGIALLVTVETGRDPSPSSCLLPTTIDMHSCII